MIELQARGDTVILPVHAQPGASRDAIREWSDALGSPWRIQFVP